MSLKIGWYLYHAPDLQSKILMNYFHLDYGKQRPLSILSLAATTIFSLRLRIGCPMRNLNTSGTYFFGLDTGMFIVFKEIMNLPPADYALNAPNRNLNLNNSVPDVLRLRIGQIRDRVAQKPADLQRHRS